MHYDNCWNYVDLVKQLKSEAARTSSLAREVIASASFDQLWLKYLECPSYFLLIKFWSMAPWKYERAIELMIESKNKYMKRFEAYFLRVVHLASGELCRAVEADRFIYKHSCRWQNGDQTENVDSELAVQLIREAVSSSALSMVNITKYRQQFIHLWST